MSEGVTTIDLSEDRDLLVCAYGGLSLTEALTFHGGLFTDVVRMRSGWWSVTKMGGWASRFFVSDLADLPSNYPLTGNVLLARGRPVGGYMAKISFAADPRTVIVVVGPGQTSRFIPPGRRGSVPANLTTFPPSGELGPPDVGTLRTAVMLSLLDRVPI